MVVGGGSNLVEVGLEVRVILGHEELVVDVAEVVERLVAAQTKGLTCRVGLLTHSAVPFAHRLLLVTDTCLALVGRGLAGISSLTARHFGQLLDFKFKYKPQMNQTLKPRSRQIEK